MKRRFEIFAKGQNGKNRDFVLGYELVTTEALECDSVGEKIIYSVLVLQNEGGITTDYEFLYDVARDEKSAVDLMELLSENGVMPYTAKSVVEDII